MSLLGQYIDQQGFVVLDGALATRSPARAEVRTEPGCPAGEGGAGAHHVGCLVERPVDFAVESTGGGDDRHRADRDRGGGGDGHEEQDELGPQAHVARIV